MVTKLMKPSLFKSGMTALALVLASSAALAQSTVTLTAAPTSTLLPDGQIVPMWGYSCNPAGVGGGASCSAANGAPQTGGWQPPLIRVPSGQTLKITLVNKLSFGNNTVPTSYQTASS